jgi:hypothetical protein
MILIIREPVTSEQLEEMLKIWGVFIKIYVQNKLNFTTFLKLVQIGVSVY